jgi:hypothetical protein
LQHPHRLALLHRTDPLGCLLCIEQAGMLQEPQQIIVALQQFDGSILAKAVIQSIHKVERWMTSMELKRCRRHGNGHQYNL